VARIGHHYKTQGERREKVKQNHRKAKTPVPRSIPSQEGGEDNHPFSTDPHPLIENGEHMDYKMLILLSIFPPVALSNIFRYEYTHYNPRFRFLPVSVWGGMHPYHHVIKKEKLLSSKNVS